MRPRHLDRHVGLAGGELRCDGGLWVVWTEKPPPLGRRAVGAAPGGQGRRARHRPRPRGPRQTPGHPPAPLPLADNHRHDPPQAHRSHHPIRTLTDLRRTIDPALYRKAVREAEFRNLALGAAPTDHTRSELERAFLRLCRRRRLPLPEVNARIDDFIVDFLWREKRLIVETDGYAAHRGRQAFEDDHTRELALHADAIACAGSPIARSAGSRTRGRGRCPRPELGPRLDPPRAIACARWGGGIAVVPETLVPAMSKLNP